MKLKIGDIVKQNLDDTRLGYPIIGNKEVTISMIKQSAYSIELLLIQFKETKKLQFIFTDKELIIVNKNCVETAK